MSTEDTPKPAAWMIRNKEIPLQQPWPTRVDSEAYFLARDRKDYEATPLFDQATLDAAVAKERERWQPAAEKARAALSEPLMTRDPIVYSEALAALDVVLGPNVGVKRAPGKN